MGTVDSLDTQNDTVKRSDSRESPIKTSGIMARHNRVSNVVLYGVPIVSLYIDGNERLCLAQISNTLLKSYSYNEIHNRRVALGITCVQCTPVQLEILRRAGAMPVSSRRCGMISRREAERLVKSFLEEHQPPKLPEDFCFDVQHDCGWGCCGHFEPTRYNSSRAKCIKCAYCSVYFSPNKFIFHFHRNPDSKYNHPDAANFNAWRRHLKLVSTDREDITHAWEDVKAMFNGGSRKRTLASVTSLSHVSMRQREHENKDHSHEHSKKSRLEYDRGSVKQSNSEEDTYNTYLPALPFPGKQYALATTFRTPPMLSDYSPSKPEAETENTMMNNFYRPWALNNRLAMAPYSIWPAIPMPDPFNMANDFTRFFRSKQNMGRSPWLFNTPVKQHGTDKDDSAILSGGTSKDEETYNDFRSSAFRPVGKASIVLSEKLQHDRQSENCRQIGECDEIDVGGPVSDGSYQHCDSDSNCSDEKSIDSESRIHLSPSDSLQGSASESADRPMNVVQYTKEETSSKQHTKKQEKAQKPCSPSEGAVSKDDLVEQLKKEIDERRKIEKEIQNLKDILKDQKNKNNKCISDISSKIGDLKGSPCGKELHNSSPHITCPESMGSFGGFTAK